MDIGQWLQEVTIEEFISKLTIVNKEGKKQTLELNGEQEEILKSLVEGKDTLILKPRQIGSTTICAAYLFAECFFSNSPITFAVLSYKLESAKQILKIIKNFYYSLPKQLQRPLDVDNTTEISFKGGGRIIAVAATQTGGLRSFTASKIQLSEYAFADNPEELKATALGALNDGQLIIESTANFYGDCLHQEIQKWETGTTNWNYLFFPWTSHQEYAVDTANLKELTDVEKEIMARFAADATQIAWRRKKISLLGIDKFTREYPLTLDEAYAITGDTYFTKKDFEYVDILPASKEGYEVFAKPDKYDSYAIGVDVGGGVGRDYSVIIVMSKRTNSPVAIYRNNIITPIDLAHRIQQLHEEYNNALILVEANNYGWAVLNELGHIGVGRLFKDEMGKDFLTTVKTKPLVFEELKKNIQQGFIKILDDITVMELRSILIDDKGRIKFQDSTAGLGHSDSAMALALANWCLGFVHLKQDGYLPEWIRNKKSKEIREQAGAMLGSHRRY